MVKCLFVLTGTDIRSVFRNEMHLGPEAHRLLATEVYSGIGSWLNTSRHTQ
jgi:hypothetical protein